MKNKIKSFFIAAIIPVKFLLFSIAFSSPLFFWLGFCLFFGYCIKTWPIITCSLIVLIPSLIFGIYGVLTHKE